MQETLDYLYRLQRFGMKLGLETMTKLMQALDNPHKKFKSVHIAGTNGKGSTAAFLASCLKEGGYSTGLYTSPHLVRFNERIQINNKLISDGEIVELAKFIKSKIEERDIQPTFFEFTTALAFLYFSNKKVDIAVIEVGLGGRLDATNILTPLVSVITTIGFDHQCHLGHTKLEIAKEKAGIIKKNVPVVVGEQDKEVHELFESICRERTTPPHYLGNELIIKKLKEKTFSTSGVIEDTFQVSLLGDFQLQNAAAALLTLYVLQKNNPQFALSVEVMKKGLLSAFWPGRLQLINNNILLDGAHNVEAMIQLQKFIKTIPKRKILILGIKKDKDFPHMIETIAPYVNDIILTEANFSPTNVELLENEAQKFYNNVYKEPNPTKALQLAQNMAGDDDIIICAGSLYLIGDILQKIKNKEIVMNCFLD